MNERVKVVKVAKVAKVVKFFKTFLVPSFCLTFRHFFTHVFSLSFVLLILKDVDRLHLLEAAKRSVLAYELQNGPLVEGAGDEQDDVVDHVAVGDVVEEGGLVTHVLELRHQLLAQLVVNHGHLVVEENFLYKLFLFSFNNN